MNRIPTREITGDVAVGRNVAAGGNAAVQGNMRVCHDLKVEGWLEARNIKGVNKGLFATAAALREAYPRPHDGWFAGVSATEADIAALGLTVAAGRALFRMYTGSGGDWVCEPLDKLYEIVVNLQEVEGLREDLTELEGRVERNKDGIDALGVQLESHDTAIKDIKAVTDSKGVAGGLAPLDSGTKVPARFLPAYVDSVKEFGGMTEGEITVHTTATALRSDSAGCMVMYHPTACRFVLQVLTVPDGGLTPSISYWADWGDGDAFGEATALGRKPVADRIYVDVTGNTSYRWSGSGLVAISSSIALGHTGSTAFPGDEGKALQEAVEDIDATADKPGGFVRLGDDGCIAEKRVAAGVPKVAFVDAMVSDVETVRSISTTLGSGDEGCAVVYDSDREAFLLRVTSGGTAVYYNNWMDSGRWGVLQDGFLKGTRGRVYLYNGKVYVWRQGRLREAGTDALGKAYNVTVEQPLAGGARYKLKSAITAAFNAGVACRGMMLTFLDGRQLWKTWLYTGADTSIGRFSNTGNWVELTADDGDYAEESGSFTSVEGNVYLPLKESVCALKAGTRIKIGFDIDFDQATWDGFAIWIDGEDTVSEEFEGNASISEATHHYEVTTELYQQVQVPKIRLFSGNRNAGSDFKVSNLSVKVALEQTLHAGKFIVKVTGEGLMGSRDKGATWVKIWS